MAQEACHKFTCDSSNRPEFSGALFQRWDAIFGGALVSIVGPYRLPALRLFKSEIVVSD